jgi:SNF2 family DNA or RNA helicase
MKRRKSDNDNNNDIIPLLKRSARVREAILIRSNDVEMNVRMLTRNNIQSNGNIRNENMETSSDNEDDSSLDNDDYDGENSDSNDDINVVKKLHIKKIPYIKNKSNHKTTIQDCYNAETQNFISLSYHIETIRPFVTSKVIQKLEDNKSNKAYLSKVISQPSSLSRECKMRSYQLEGLKWLVSQYDQRINCILADEMGLGKTLQSISFIAYLLHVRKVAGPHLIVAPLSVLFNWIVEIRKWCPSIKVQRIHTNDDKERERLKIIMHNRNKTEVVVTSYQTISSNLKNTFKNIIWQTIFLDEGNK